MIRPVEMGGDTAIDGEATSLGVATTYSGKGVGLLHAVGRRHSRGVAPCGRFARRGR